MPRTPLRTLGALAVIAGAGILTTCTTDSSGPGRRGAFAVEPVLPPMLHLSAFNLTVDNVRLTVVRPPGETVYDTIVAFPANQGSLQLSADIPLDQSPESFDVTIQMLSGSQLLFSGTQSVLVSEGSNNTPAQIPLTYAGPGQNIATLSIDPPDSLLTWDGTLAFRSTALDAQQSPVTSYYLSWSTNDATVPIDATGQLAAPHFRKTVTVTATTPTNISASTTLTLLPAPSAITVSSGCGQTAAPGSLLPQPVVAKVIAADNGGVQGVTVTFTPPAGGMAVPAQVVTDANGLAQTTVTLAPTAGPQPFAISAPGLASFPCTQTATGVATHLAFTSQPTNVAVGSPITPA
ncbi:MAG TPA: Ig-like domain-containing protein, partial [Gemmatimonadales bacterium]|nr:Ig-like domain-containing protein [Gemmatimonadales bacterium]